jgi:hypothetical protein
MAKIITKYDPPPIPLRQFDWSAVDDATYDIAGCVGYGRTEAEAIADLQSQLEELRPEEA